MQNLWFEIRLAKLLFCLKCLSLVFEVKKKSKLLVSKFSNKMYFIDFKKISTQSKYTHLIIFYLTIVKTDEINLFC